MNYLAIRYRASAADPAITDNEEQDQVVEAVLSRLEDVLTEDHADTWGKKLVLVFDQEFVASQRVPIIDIICFTPEACDIIRNNLKFIQVEDEGGDIISYEAQRCNGLMPQDMLAVDFCAPDTLAAGELDIFVEALQQKVLPIGQLVSPVRIAVGTSTEVKDSFARYIHAYIKLSPASLTLSYEDLDRRCPPWLTWKRTQLRFDYQDRHLRCYHDYALRRPNRCAKPSLRPLLGPMEESTISGSSNASEATKRKRKHSSSE